VPRRIYLLENDELLAALKRTRMQRGKLVFGIFALIMVVLGLAIYIFSNELGIEPGTAKLIAAAFLIAGAADYLILHFWDRIYDRFE